MSLTNNFVKNLVTGRPNTFLAANTLGTSNENNFKRLDC